MAVEIAYDLSYLNNIASGDKDFVQDMLETFVISTPEFLQKIEQFLSENNFNELYYSVHKFIANVQFIGLTPTLEKLKKFEKWIQEKKNTELYAEITDEIVIECNKAIEVLKNDFNIN